MYKKSSGIIKYVVLLVFLVAIGAIAASLLTGCAAIRWTSTGYWNGVEYVNQKIDDETNYKTLKQVEDTCRAMISSYESDKLTYEQYKRSEDEEKRSWAEQAMMLANKTASSYNNYILVNSYVWASNIPADIRTELPILE